MNHKIIMFIGPSCSGKDTFFAKALALYKFVPIRLHTTRPMRENEREGIEYYFITKEEMDLLEKNGQLIERRDYNTIHGIWSYATSKTCIDLTKNHYLTTNTWVGFEQFLKCYSKNEVIPLYFSLEDGKRLERALNREKQKNQDYAEMCRRFLADQKDFTKEYLEKYQPILIDNNGTQEETLAQLDEALVRKLGIEKKFSSFLN